jgi:hypothetical protein
MASRRTIYTTETFILPNPCTLGCIQERTMNQEDHSLSNVDRRVQSVGEFVDIVCAYRDNLIDGRSTVIHGFAVTDALVDCNS